MSLYQERLVHRYMPADKQANDYAYVPFTLAAPARRLTVTYCYSDAMSSDQVEGGNVVDIGLFDPRGRVFPGGAGFRGWSGSARQTFTITASEATPGYLPGPLPAGTYHVILGLYRIWDKGADVTIDVEAELDEHLSSARSQPAVPAAGDATAPVARRTDVEPQAMRWLRGDLQSHTVHSDAKGTLAQLVEKARVLRLDFLAVTDHNTISHHPFLPDFAGDDLILIAGQEATTYYGHMNIWGAQRWCDFRCQTDDEMAAVIELAHANGGLCSINHPKEGGPAWTYTTELPVDAMEVWQGPWPHRNWESLRLWDALLNAGRRLPAVGGSDYHCPSGAETNFLRLGQPTTWVQVYEQSAAGILEAIAAGRACVSATPDGARLDLSAAAGDRTVRMGELIDSTVPVALSVRVQISRGEGRHLHLIADGEVVHTESVTDDDTVVTVDLPVRTYVRAELVGDVAPETLPAGVPADLPLSNWRWALSNPIYVQAG